MAAMTLPKGSIMSWAARSEYDPLNPGAATWHSTSEHNRSELSVDVNRIERTTRTVSGTLRKWWVADKRSFSTSWDMLPDNAAKTVDGKWGGSEMEEFYKNNYGEFWLRIREPSGVYTVYLVVFKSFSKEVKKRGAYEFWSVGVELEEV